MKISTSCNYYPKYQCNTNNLKIKAHPNDSVFFRSLSRNSPINNPNLDQDRVYNDSCFFRDFPTLDYIVNYINTNYKTGATIMDYACSNGEEAKSITMMLEEINSDKKHKIVALDIDDSVIELAKAGQHAVNSIWLDNFLLNNDSKLTDTEKKLKKLFLKYFEIDHTPNKNLNNSMEYTVKKIAKGFFFKEKYYKQKPDTIFNDVITYIGGKNADLCNIKSVTKDLSIKPNVILFRNAWYHITGHIRKTEDKANPWIQNPEKLALVKTIVDKIYNTLPLGGLLVCGNIENDHIFLASDKTPKEQTINYNELPTVQEWETKAKSKQEKVKKAFYIPKGLKNKILEQINYIIEFYNFKFLKESPITSIIEANGRFEPVFYSDLQEVPGYKVPTVWRKVK